MRVVLNESNLGEAAECEQGQQQTHLGHPTYVGRVGVGGGQNTEEAQRMRQTYPYHTVWSTKNESTHQGNVIK